MNLAHLFRNADANELNSCFLEARAALESAFEVFEPLLKSGDFSVPKIPVVNLPLWELGHVAWFQERWLLRNLERDLGVACNPRAKLLPSMLPSAQEFYDSTAVAHDKRWALPLPDIDTTKQYAAQVLAKSLEALREQAGSQYLFWLCAAHEFMHAEAFAYTLNTLNIPGADAFTEQCKAKSKVMRGVHPELMDANIYSFDNESAEQLRQMALIEATDLDLDVLPVSWESLNEFRQSTQFSNKKYWPGVAGNFLDTAVRKTSLSDDLSSPAAHVSYWEAQAWCLWHGRALPTEAQWLAGIANGNLQWGQVWEWTRSEFSPYAGFVAHPYEEYSAPWFNNGFQVLKGGSYYTHERMKHPLYRNFFRPERDDVCTGFRSCRAG
jgi:gamma-glutamyl hercynylcysteine S-oxide synthase